MAEERFYQAYMVRLWAVHRNHDLLWRASIENVHSGERRAFADVAGLCTFLCAAVAPPVTMQDERDAAAAHSDEVS